MHGLLLTLILAAKVEVLENDTNLCVEEVLRRIVKEKDIICQVNVNLKLGLPSMVIDTKVRQLRNFRYLQPSIYIINISNNTSEVFKLLHELSLMNPRGLFIITNAEVDDNVYETIHNYFIRNLYIITKTNPHNSSWELQQNICSRTVLKLKKIHVNHKRTLKVLYDDYPPFIINPNKGLNIELIKMVANGLKINVKFVKPSQHWTDSTFNAVWEQMETKKYDMYGGLIVVNGELLKFDRTFEILEDKAYFVVPRIPREEPSTFLREYTVNLRITLVALTILGIVLFYLIHKEPFIVFGIVLENSVGSTTNRYSFRFLLVSYVFTFMLLNNLYRSKMFYFMTSRGSDQAITSLQDLVNSEINIGLHQIVQNQLNSSDNYHEKTLAERSIPCDISLTCLNRTAFQRDLATVKLVTGLKYSVPRLYVDREGKSLLYILKDYQVSYLSFGFVFLKAHPTFEKFNTYLMVLTEGGFVDNLYRELEKGNERAMSLAEAKQLRAETLGISRFQGTFSMYGVGVLICLIVFCLEILYYRLQ